MKGLGTVATLFLIIAAAGAVASVLQLAIIGMLLFGVLFRLRETLTFLASCALLAFINRYPWAFAATMALALLVNSIGRSSRSPHL